MVSVSSVRVRCFKRVVLGNFCREIIVGRPTVAYSRRLISTHVIGHIVTCDNKFGDKTKRQGCIYLFN